MVRSGRVVADAWRAWRAEDMSRQNGTITVVDEMDKLMSSVTPCGAAHSVDGLTFFFSSRRRHTRFDCDWSSDVCSSDLASWSSSMAPSTACSASLLQGTWRPANSRSGEETAGDADVIPGRFLPMGVPEQGGRMVRNDNRDAPKPVDLVAERAQRLLGIEQRLRRGAARSEEHTSELQSQSNLVCRLLLEKKKKAI